MLAGITENRIDSSTAVPSVPPIWRKKVAELVATPMSFASTEPCDASVRDCMTEPSPRPMRNMPIIRNQSGLSIDMKVRTT